VEHAAAAEAALDHSIDRKVRILLRLRKDFADRPGVPSGQGEGVAREKKKEPADNDNMSEHSKGREAVVETPKMTERSGNVFENKSSSSARQERSRSVAKREVVGMS
jgi:hypothetical protein